MPSLPPYLTSGASSRSHHALLVKLHEAKSDEEEDEIVEKEIERQKDLMNVKGQSTTRLAESMIVILHIAMIRHNASTDLAFALVHALQLAESGRTIREKRIGYLFLQERLSPDHELALMLINTIRKDLSSQSPQHILLALHAIVKMPSRDLSPAVTPLLSSKKLLKHKLPAIRQRTIQAICALHSTEGGFPLSMSKLVRMSSTEEDESVLSVIVRTIHIVLERDLKPITAKEEAIFLCDRLINIASARLEQRGALLHECLCALRQVMDSPHGAECEAQVNGFLEVLISNLSIDDSAGGAVLLEICRLVATFRSPAIMLAKRLLAIIGRGLLPSETSSSTPYIPKPNVHVLVLRCLHTLPVAIWDGHLGETEMEVLMEGLNSSDDTIRRSTLRLLKRLSPELLVATLNNHLRALRTSTNLSLPLHAPTSLEEKTVAGRLETSGRALEVVEIMYCDKDTYVVEKGDDGDNGGRCARAFVQILVALNEGVLNSAATPEPSGRIHKGQVWEEGLRRMSRILEDNTFRMAFTVGILRTRIGSATLAVLRCTTLTSAPLDPQLAKDAIQVLSVDLADFGPSVQEIILVTVSVILSQIVFDRQQVIDSIRQVQLDAGSYIKKRCGQIVDLIQHDLLAEVMRITKTRLIPDVLEAIVGVHKKWRKSQRPTSATSVNSPLSPSYSISKGPTSLRYDAYDPPSSSLASLSLGRGSREAIPRHPQVSARSALTPGDLALFDADEEDRLNSAEAPKKGKPGRIAIPRPMDGVLDLRDEARTPTMRESSHVGR